MADLDILITDENGEILRRLSIYLDGSDSEEAEKIEKAITDLYCYPEWNYV